MMKELDLRDLEVVKLLPEDINATILTVGSGTGRIEWHIRTRGYNVLATDIARKVEWDDASNRTFQIMNIMKPNQEQRDVVMCLQVIEHLSDYKTAVRNLIKLAKKRVIITTPYKYSFNDPGHCNHWDNDSINVIKEIAKPYKVTISKIITKQKDLETGQRCFLICIDK